MLYCARFTGKVNKTEPKLSLWEHLPTPQYRPRPPIEHLFLIEPGTYWLLKCLYGSQSSLPSPLTSIFPSPCPPLPWWWERTEVIISLTRQSILFFYVVFFFTFNIIFPAWFFNFNTTAHLLSPCIIYEGPSLFCGAPRARKVLAAQMWN